MKQNELENMKERVQFTDSMLFASMMDSMVLLLLVLVFIDGGGLH